MEMLISFGPKKDGMIDVQRTRGVNVANITHICICVSAYAYADSGK